MRGHIALNGTHHASLKGAARYALVFQYPGIGGRVPATSMRTVWGEQIQVSQFNPEQAAPEARGLADADETPR